MIALLMTILFTMPNQDVTCNDQDCLKSGWIQQAQDGTGLTQFQCYGSGCSTAGWIAGGYQGLNYYTQCKAKGCFTEGWYYIDRDNHAMLGNVVCQKQDCLSQGWVTYFNDQQSSSLTQCRDQDCRKNGWTEKYNWNYVKAYCKKNDCFKYGWRSF